MGLTGPAGATGATGPAGPQGPIGPTGPAGTGGGGIFAGKTVLNNSSNPDPAYATIAGFGSPATTIVAQQLVVPMACTLSNLAINADAFASSHTFTVEKNSADTTLACTVGSGGTSCSSTNTVSAAVGDLIALKINGGAGGNYNLRYSVTCQ
jgi:hypothetical protein